MFRVLFVCTGNICRSPTAEGIFRSLVEARARSVRPDDYENFDLILTMDSGHYRSLERSCPAAFANRVQLFMDYAPETGITDVPDPYYGAGDGFARVFDMIEIASMRLLSNIETQHIV